MDDEAIVTIIKSHFPNAILESRTFRGELTLVVKKDYIPEIASFLKQNEALDFNYLSDLCGVDRIEKNGVFEVVYHLYSLRKNHRLRLKVPVSANEPSISTVTGVWTTANWHERETYDMFGIKFGGHPDLRKILMPDDFEGHPLRKDYPVEGRQPSDLRSIYRKDTE
ncbi:MAG: NADH-quinone oxidoreductase subunit C [Candidatus Brocadiaceae bacterium]|nr:NADH-quinone oxidoreductase subunit C [Candidatus Brocadiaceae bacterium]